MNTKDSAEGLPKTKAIDFVIIGCDYEEHKPWTYNGVYLAYEIDPISGDTSKVQEVFKSDSPTRDKNSALAKAETIAKKVSVSSTWHNFISDALNHAITGE